jgi:amino acid transporter
VLLQLLLICTPTQRLILDSSDIPLVLCAYGGYKLIRRTKIVPLDMVPLRQALDEAENDPENVPLTKDSLLSKLNILWG